MYRNSSPPNESDMTTTEEEEEGNDGDDEQEQLAEDVRAAATYLEYGHHLDIDREFHPSMTESNEKQEIGASVHENAAQDAPNSGSSASISIADTQQSHQFASSNYDNDTHLADDDTPTWTSSTPS